MTKKMKIIVASSIAVVIIGLAVSFGIYKSLNGNYSANITNDEASELINLVKYERDEEDFELWDLQKIDDSLYLVSYSEEVVTDVFVTDRSWIVFNNNIVYETNNGDLVLGRDLDKTIASKFNHNIKTYESEKKTVDIDFEKTEVESNRVLKGTESIYVTGEKGIKSITEESLFINGTFKEKETEEKITKEPVDEVVLIGTFVAPPPPPPPAITTIDTSSVDGKRTLTWYNTGYNRDGSVARWAHKKYGDYTFIGTGCVPTAMAIAFSGYDVHVNPETVGDWLHNNGYFNNKYLGTGGNGVVAGIQAFGLQAQGLSSESAVVSALQRGNVVLAAIGSGKFAAPGVTHMVVLNGYRNGVTYVTDPSYANKSSNTAVSSLWANQSSDSIDTEAGFVFFEIVGGGLVEEVEPEIPETTEPEKPKPEEPKEPEITEPEVPVEPVEPEIPDPQDPDKPSPEEPDNPENSDNGDSEVTESEKIEEP